MKKLMKKICLLGDGAVGKTSLIRKYVFDRFEDKYIMTFGTKVSKKQITIHRDGEEYNLTFLIWDILGQRVHNNLHSAYYKGASGAFIICDTTRLETLEGLKEWIRVFRGVNEDSPLILLGNKFDLVDQAQFGSEELGQVASELDVPHHMTSAKTGAFVEESFMELGNKVIDHYLRRGGKKP